MNGIKIAGKAFIAFECLRHIAEQNKGKTVCEYLNEQRKARLEYAEAIQFGVPETQFRGLLGR